LILCGSDGIFSGSADSEDPFKREISEKMPNIKSAKKRMELSRKWNEANRQKRSTLRTAIKKVRNASSADEAQESFRQAVVLIDRAATKRLLHPNQAARIKSRLSRHIAGL
jgi:small subunit ribosomal protein S20